MNKTKESYQSHAVGWVKIWGTDKDGKRHLLVDKKNAIQPNSRNIVAKLLAGLSSASLDQISVWNAGVLLANNTTFAVSSPTTDTVVCNARFDEASFSGAFDELRVGSIGYGDFSTLTGISATKTLTLQLHIEWIITINAV